jgi:hypothetical protein
MDHAEARELLELAAVEPGGFDRLIAGDTANASALAGHLAGCESCADEMARLRRASAVIREVVRTSPPADLRDRTLAFVREVGRARSRRVEHAEVPAREVGVARGEHAGPTGVAAAPPANVVPIGAASGRLTSLGSGRWLAAMAAAIVLAVAGTAFVVQSRNDQTVQRQTAVIDGLSRVTSWYIDVEAQPDAQRIDLTSPNGGVAAGTAELSASRGQLVVVASGLTEPPAGQELRCWIEIGGERRTIGRMFFGGGLAYWAGPISGLSSIGPGAHFGVSAPGGESVLEGQVEG